MEGGTPIQFLHGENTNERKENHMKNFKKIMALVIAAMMIVGTMNMGAFAAAPDDTIEVSGLQEGDVVKFYQILEWGGSNAASTSGWQYKAPFSEQNVGLSVDALIGNPAKNIDPGITPAIAGTIAKIPGTATPTFPALTVQPGEPKVVQPITYSTDHEEQLGLYLALITPANADYVYNPVFVSADFVDAKTNSWIVDSTTSAYFGNKAATKKSEPGVEKEAHVTEESYQDGDWRSTKIGETVSFTSTAVIPAFSDVFQNPHFVMKDVMTDLELDFSSVKVTGLTENNEYTKAQYSVTTTSGVTKKGFEITFDPTYLKTITAPTKVVVTYDAKVSSDAKLNVNEEKNEVWIEYNHDPTNEGDFEVKKDDTKHYTFGIDAEIWGGGSSQIHGSTSEIVKVGLGPDGKEVFNKTERSHFDSNAVWKSPLEDCLFGLYTDSACTKPYIPLDKQGQPTSALQAYSDATGRITFEGLDAGTYYLKEISAPTGWIKSNEILQINIHADWKDVPTTMYYVKGSDWANGSWQEAKPNGTLGVDYKEASYNYYALDSYYVEVGKVGGPFNKSLHRFNNVGPETVEWLPNQCYEVPSSIINTQGVELPSTGGMGTTLFYAIGAVLVLGAGILLVSKRRMSAY
jgi:fimbrial isopeptide formation D2 family protein/LPXTG-motif cell wall-anchored protein